MSSKWGIFLGRATLRFSLYLMYVSRIRNVDTLDESSELDIRITIYHLDI